MLKNLFTPKSNGDVSAPSHGLLLDYPALMARVAEQAPNYAGNAPFPHIVIDNFLPPSTFARLLQEYPHDQSDPLWNNATHTDKASG